MNSSFDTSSVLKQLSYGDTVRPSRDWFYLLLVASLLILISAGWNAWLFRSVMQGDVIGDAEAPTAFDAAPIESVREVFEARAGERERYGTEYRFVDPSR